MQEVRTLIVGAGISGLAAAAALGGDDYLVLEGDAEIGGYCKTIKKEGFVWDYSGHFFHFKHPEIEAWLRERIACPVRTVEKVSNIHYKGQFVDFPFQKNIHQLDKTDFIDCLHDLYFARMARGEPRPERHFKDMLYARYGRSIAEAFLIPYNEKLYACDLATLDRDAMGRFFPHADLDAIIANMKTPDNASYNATFTYPEGGAIEYVKALASAVRPESVALSEPVVNIDPARKVARTPRREIRFERLVSSAPLPRLLAMCGTSHDANAFTWNKVLVFNLGFDRKGPPRVHWTYYPDKSLSFYRVGFYDNIFDAERLSIYVEVGLTKDASPDVADMQRRVLADLERVGVTKGHKLVAQHSVVMDPAYVHITKASLAEHARAAAVLRACGIHSIGRYGGWTYCSIEDNIVEARELVASWS